MKLALEGGDVFYQGKLQRVNVLIENGVITQISESPLDSKDKINVAGMTILPGLIDVHVHLREPGMSHKEDISSGTSAAAAGGVTTVLDMPNTKPATTTQQLLEEKRRLFSEKAVVNYGLYLGATKSNIDEINAAKNIAGVKLYMGSSTGDLLVTDEAVIKDIFSTGRKIVVHAEDEELLKDHEKRHKAREDALVHAEIRNPAVAVSALWKALSIAKDTNANVHFTHTSSAEEMKLLREAKKTLTITADTTPHHLFLTQDELSAQGNFAKMNPALRSSEDVETLWEAVRDGTIDIIATDHAGHTTEEKEADYWNAPSGVPGLETMLPLLLDAVHKGKLTLEKVVELCCSNPAKIFNIKNKGSIEVGNDADLVIVDMNQEKTVMNENLFTKCKWSPFNGWTLKGWPIMTLVRGNIVYDGSIYQGQGREVVFT